MKYRISTEPVTMANGEILTEADFERMALEAETIEVDSLVSSYYVRRTFDPRCFGQRMGTPRFSVTVEMRFLTA